MGFRGWSTGGHCLQGHGDLWVFWLAVDLKKRKDKQGYISWVLGVARVGILYKWTIGILYKYVNMYICSYITHAFVLKLTCVSCDRSM